MKLCINCKHNVRGVWCESPANGLSPVNGKPKTLFALVSRGTSTLGNCGPDAVNFEPISHTKSGGFTKAFNKIFSEWRTGK